MVPLSAYHLVSCDFIIQIFNFSMGENDGKIADQPSYDSMYSGMNRQLESIEVAYGALVSHQPNGHDVPPIIQPLSTRNLRFRNKYLLQATVSNMNLTLVNGNFAARYVQKYSVKKGG